MHGATKGGMLQCVSWGLVLGFTWCDDFHDARLKVEVLQELGGGVTRHESGFLLSTRNTTRSDQIRLVLAYCCMICCTIQKMRGHL